MAYPPQLTPVQAWLLGYMDTDTLRDLLHDQKAEDGFAAYGIALCDEAYRTSLIVEAQNLLENPVRVAS